MAKKNLSDISQEVSGVSEGSLGELVAGFAALPPETQSAFLGGKAINVFCGRNENCKGANCISGCGGSSEELEMA